MKVLINTATLFKGGAVQVARSFINECIHHSNNEYVVVLSERLSKEIKVAAFPANFTFLYINYRPATKVKFLNYQDAYLANVEKEHKPNVMITTSGPAYYKANVPHVMGYNLPHYIYRDSPFFKSLSFSKNIKWWLKGALIKFFYKRDADLLVCQTNDVQQRARKLTKIDGITVSNTCSKEYFSFNKTQYNPRLTQTGTFKLLTLSAFYPHKNLEIINDIVEILLSKDINDIRFVLTLPKDDLENNFTKNTQKFIENIGPIPANEGPGLYSECDAMFLPTLLECFSASYAESMAMDKPIITSDLSFAKSICDDAALFYKPMNAHAAFDKIIALKVNVELQNQLIEKGRHRLKSFSTPETRAAMFLNACASLID